MDEWAAPVNFQPTPVQPAIAAAVLKQPSASAFVIQDGKRTLISCAVSIQSRDLFSYGFGCTGCVVNMDKKSFNKSLTGKVQMLNRKHVCSSEGQS